MRPAPFKVMLAAVVAVAGMLSFVSLPAQAARSSPLTADSSVTAQGNVFRIVSVLTDNPEIGYCLDSNEHGLVYVMPCSDNNDFQRWEIWFGGWVRNLRTQRCLTLKPGWFLSTELNCGWGNPYQEWKQWNGGWFQNHYDNACITWEPRYGRSYGVERCIWGEPTQHWYVLYF